MLKSMLIDELLKDVFSVANNLTEKKKSKKVNK